MKTQVKDQELRLDDGLILLQGMSYTIAEAKQLVKQLQTLIKQNCNVAITPQPMARSLFESVDNPEVLNIYIDTDQDFLDIRTALKVEKDSLVRVLDALMEYYKEREALNIIIKGEVLRNHGDSYLRHTAQFGQQISNCTQEFLKVKAIYDRPKGLLGIFCRKSDFDLQVTFFGQLVETMLQKNEAFVTHSDLPETYRDFPSMLHFKLKKKLDNQSVKMQKLKSGLRFYLPKVQKSI